MFLSRNCPKRLGRTGCLAAGLVLLALAAALGLLQPQAALADTGGFWTKTGSLNLDRFNHTATLLPNGKVLVAGGHRGVTGLTTNTAELYDPASGTWSFTGSLSQTRALHTATLLPNGKVLVAGGVNGNSGLSVTSCELYDPATGTWSSTGDLKGTRMEHTATLLPYTGKVLVVGGFNPNTLHNLLTAELYDPATGAWSPTGSLQYQAPSVHTATYLPVGLPYGKVLTAGGFNANTGLSMVSCEIYDVQSGTWSRTGSLFQSRETHTATLLPKSGKVLVTGGRDENTDFSNTSCELYDPGTGAWSNTGFMFYPRDCHTATFLLEGNVLVVGGWDAQAGLSLNNAELYNPATGAWKATGSLQSEPRDRHTATLLPSGKVLIAGGLNGHSGLSVISAELYTPSTCTIYATALEHGQIFPSGAVQVVYGANQTFTIKPNPDYRILDVEVDGASVGDKDSYTFFTVTSNHTIKASFAPIAVSYKITVTQGANGTISPGTVWVNSGDTPTFTITPNSGYQVADVLVDGASVGAVTSYKFPPVTANHTITASFAPITTYTITVTQGANGTISPSGTVTVNSGDTPTFTITANSGYQVADVKVDGASVGAVTSYKFPPVTADHSITASFKKIVGPLPPLLVFYPFEGNAQDASGNRKHGAVVGATLTTGYEGQAYSFNGTNNYIMVPLDISPSQYPQLTMGAWAKAASPSNPRRQVLSQDNGGFDRSLLVGDTGWGAFCGSGGVLCGDPVVEGEWVFLAVVYDQAAGTVKLWVEDKSYTQTGVTLGAGTNLLRIGMNPGFGELFAGTIDNVFIFNGALTDDQIASIRAGGSSAILGRSGSGKSLPWVLLLLSD